MKHFSIILFQYQWLLLAAAAFTCGLFMDTLDVALHDTYYVIPGHLVGSAIACLMIIFWGLMRLRIFKKSGLIYYIHQVGTSISVVVLLLLLMNPPSVPAQRIYSDYSVYDNFDSISEAANYYVNVWVLLLVTLALLQLCWIAQLVSGLRKR